MKLCIDIELSENSDRAEIVNAIGDAALAAMSYIQNGYVLEVDQQTPLNEISSFFRPE